jgi:hypothetical protein
MKNENDSVSILPHRLRFLEIISEIHESIEALNKLNYRLSATGQLIRDY